LVELAQDVEEYRRHGVDAAAVLPQRASAAQAYLKDQNFPFDVLLDEDRQVVKAYGVWHRIGLDAWNTSRPAVFLIEQDRSIRYSFIGESQREFPALADILRAIQAG
jgi:peroxiredoxin